jgi:hypothetical protein
MSSEQKEKPMSENDEETELESAFEDRGEVLDLLDASNFQIHEVTENEMVNWLHEEFHGTHPDELVRRTFPVLVMKAITSGHHKGRDGVFSISYDFFAKRWFVEHPGYVREVEIEGDSYLDAASKYISAIDRENGSVLYRDLEDAANRRLAPEYSVEIGEDSMTLYRSEKGRNRMKVHGAFEKENPSVEDLVNQLNEWITARY